MTRKEKQRIIPATEKDADPLAKLIRTSYADVARRFLLTPKNCPKHPSNCTHAWVTRDLQRGVHYALLTSDTVLIGCVGVEKASVDNCYLERLAVRPGARSQGCGTRLVLHALDLAKSMDALTAGIGIIAADTGLKKFYRALGFNEGKTKTFPHLPFEVAFMQISL